MLLVDLQIGFVPLFSHVCSMAYLIILTDLISPTILGGKCEIYHLLINTPQHLS
jgi:hypothetical protein